MHPMYETLLHSTAQFLTCNCRASWMKKMKLELNLLWKKSKCMCSSLYQNSSMHNHGTLDVLSSVISITAGDREIPVPFLFVFPFLYLFGVFKEDFVCMSILGSHSVYDFLQWSSRLLSLILRAISGQYSGSNHPLFLADYIFLLQ